MTLASESIGVMDTHQNALLNSASKQHTAANTAMFNQMALQADVQAAQ